MPPIFSLQTALKSVSVSCCLLVSAINYGQSRINGKIVYADGQPARHANVLLLKSIDSALFQGAIANETGDYYFTNIPPGQFFVSGSAAGFATVFSSTVNISENSSDHTIEPLQLRITEVELKNVTVVGRKPLFEQKIDRMIVNVENSITAAGSTALEVLERSPGIIHNQQNNSISMMGKDPVMFMFNGKVSRMPASAVVQMLAGMSASNIEKIELITTPPANLDAEGNAGFINIVMKENVNVGTNGAFGLSFGYGKWESVSGNTNFNHRKGKWNLYGDYSFSRRHDKQIFRFGRVTEFQNTITETETSSDRNTVQRNHTGRLGIDYEVNSKTIVGILFSGYDNRWSMDAFNHSRLLRNDRLDSFTTISNEEVNQWKHWGTNLNIQRQLPSEGKLLLNLDYVYYKDNNPTSYLNTFYDGMEQFHYKEQTRSTKLTPISFRVGSIDYSLRLSRKIQMESGAKWSWSRFTNDVQVSRFAAQQWKNDEEFTARYQLNEKIGAGYATMTVQFNERSQAKMGLRYELTASNLGTETVKDIVDRHYGNLFPTIYLSHKFTDKQSVNLAYNRRITRPTFNDMAPFVIFMDPSTFFSGNPALQPSLSNSVKLDYLIKNFIFSGVYTVEENAIVNFSPQIDPETNRQTFAAENIPSRKTASFSAAIPVHVNSRWRLQNNIIATRQELNAIYKGDPLKIVQQNFNVRSVHTVSLPKDFTAEVSGMFQSAVLFGMYTLKPFGRLDLGIQKKIPANRSSVRLSASDVLGTMKMKMSINEPEKNLVFNGYLRFTYPQVRITYTKNFGKDKLRQKRARTTGSEEERGRVQ